MVTYWKSDGPMLKRRKKSEIKYLRSCVTKRSATVIYDLVDSAVNCRYGLL